MEQLTDKQIKARAYYAKNAEKIKNQKRVIYSKTVNRKIAPKVKLALPGEAIEKQKKNTKPNYQLSQTFIINTDGGNKEHIPDYKDRKISARQRIEDIKIKKQLNANSFE